MANRWTSFFTSNQLNWVMNITTAATVLALTGSIFAFVSDPGVSRADYLRVELQETQLRIEALTAKLAAQQRNVAALSQKPIDDPALQTKIAEIDQLRFELDQLKAIIIENPAKALQLPMMQKDLSDISKRQDDLASTIDVQIGRIYDFSKWFLALMITLTIGLVSMGFVNARKAST